MAKCRECGRWGLFIRSKLCRNCRNKLEEITIKMDSIPKASIRLRDEKHKPGSLAQVRKLRLSNLDSQVNLGDFVVIDTETTGLKAGKDEIVELGAVKFCNGKPVALFSTLINPGIPIPQQATKINGITDRMVKTAPTIGQVLTSFDEFIGESDLVAHNLEFDLGFIHNAGSKVLREERRYFCTLAAARSLLKAPKRGEAKTEYHDVENHRLGTLCNYFDIIIPDQHRAYADAYCTGLLFLKLTALTKGETPLKKVP